MNPHDSIDPREALTDALLREHARLGSLDDEGLIATIRARTVTRTIAAVEFAAPRSLRPRTTRREWLQIAAIVVLSFTVIGLFLSRQGWKRTEQTHQLVSLPAAPITATVQTGDSRPSEGKSPLGFVSTPDIRGISLAEFSISAQNASRLAPGLMIYEGDVILRHPDFIVKAERLELTATGAAESDPVGGFVASGDGVEIEMRSASGVIEIARASQATYDADGSRLILAGGPTLSSGNSFVQPLTTAGVIILRPDGYEVIEQR